MATCIPCLVAIVSISLAVAHPPAAGAGPVGFATASALPVAALAQTPEDAPAATSTTTEPTRVSGAQATLKTDGSALARKVARAIRADGTFAHGEGLRLSIAAAGSVVVLTGRAATLYDRNQAARIAEGVSGVTGIRPSIRIEPGRKVDPQTLESEVQQAVARAGVAGSDFMAKATADGTVQLAGEVSDSWMAVEAARRVLGVTAIGGFDARLPGHPPPAAQGTLTVRPSTAHDEELTRRVQEALVADGLSSISASVKNGIVSLGGSVPLHQTLAACEVAGRIAGVRGVVNSISTPGRAFRRGTTPDDKALERGVRKALGSLLSSAGTGFSLSRVDIRVAGGRVYLSGRAGSAEAASAAIERAASVRGVHEVVSALSYPALSYGS